MAYFRGKRVSRRWRRVLTAAEKAGVKFTLNSGRRTLAEQRDLYRRYLNGTGNLAAYPNPNAPHIRVGRQAHALDVDTLDGGESRLQRWLEKHGVRVSNPVRGEPWHLEVPEKDLRRLARKIRKRRKKAKRIKRVSAAGVNLVADFEGGQSADGKFRAYRDPVGVWTIGYGHTRTARSGMVWSARKARRVLRRELNKRYAVHVARLGLPLNQAQFDALTSFVYNLGPGAIGPDTGIGRALRAKQWRKAADEMLRWNKAGGRVLAGLTRRRRAERKLFLSGKENR